MAHRYLLITVLCFLLAACGGQKVKPENSAERYFQEGEKYYEKNLYEDAIASWEKVRDSYYSPALNMLAELKIAETYYISERYAEAAVAYEDFLKRHPNDFRLATILYRLGLSHYQQILSADRDQSSTENALKTFNELIKRFPDDPQSQEASYLVQRCHNRLAEHEVYVGRYYLKAGNFQAAINRLEKALANTPNYYYLDELYFYLGQAYLKAGDKNQAEAKFNRLFEEFPGSDYLVEAKEILAEES